jgi:hypothetical protein
VFLQSSCEQVRAAVLPIEAQPLPAGAFDVHESASLQPSTSGRLTARLVAQADAIVWRLLSFRMLFGSEFDPAAGPAISRDNTFRFISRTDHAPAAVQVGGENSTRSSLDASFRAIIAPAPERTAVALSLRFRSGHEG